MPIFNHYTVQIHGEINLENHAYVPPGHGLPRSPLTVSLASFCNSSTARTSLAFKNKSNRIPS